jgi:hypothetical protein
VDLAWYPRLARLIRSLPVGEIIRSALYALHVNAILTNRYGGLFAMLQRVHPIPPITAADLDDKMLQAFVGKAECLRDNPLFAPQRLPHEGRAPHGSVSALPSLESRALGPR